jgi:energy-coupling factor transport system permease protein
MIKGISIGNYLAGQSIIHKLDPRTKIISIFALIVALLTIKGYLSLIWIGLFYIFLLKLSNIKISYIFKGLKPIVIIIIFTIIIHLFLTPGKVIYSIGPVTITNEGVQKGIIMAARLTLLIGFSILLTATTPPIRLTDGLERLFSPLKIIKLPVTELALMVSIALRFIPTYITETERIIKAQTSRGIDFYSGNFKERLENLLPILIPLFLSSFKRAEDLAMAMESRCYRGGEGRTRLYPLKYQLKDWLALLFLSCFLIGLFYLNN